MHWYKLLLFCSSLFYGAVASNDFCLRDPNGFSKDDYSLEPCTSLKPLDSTITYNRSIKRHGNTCDYSSDWEKMVCNYIPGPYWFYAAASLYIIANAVWWIGDALNGFSHAIQAGNTFKESSFKASTLKASLAFLTITFICYYTSNIVAKSVVTEARNLKIVIKYILENIRFLMGC